MSAIDPRERDESAEGLEDGLIDFENKYVVVRNLEKLKNICW